VAFPPGGLVRGPVDGTAVGPGELQDVQVPPSGRLRAHGAPGTAEAPGTLEEVKPADRCGGVAHGGAFP